MLNAYSGIIINTGEDNYLTTADAVEQAPAVLASQFINEEFAHRAGMPDRQIGLGDAYEIDPDLRRRISVSGRAGAARAPNLPGCAAQVHAADQTHDRRHFQGPSDRRDVQLDVGHDAADDPPVRHADRGDSHAVPRRPRALARKRALHHEYGAAFRRRDQFQAQRHRGTARSGGAGGLRKRCSNASPIWG